MKSQAAVFIIIFTALNSRVRQIKRLACGTTDYIHLNFNGGFCVANPVPEHLLYTLVP